MKITSLTSDVLPPVGAFSYAMEVRGATQLVVFAGQTPVASDGSIPEGITAQTHLCFKRIKSLLEEAGMDMTNVLRLNYFLVDRADFKDFISARASEIGECKPAATMVYVNGLANENYRIEIEVLAAA